ncbi:MAG: hypothetical protein ACLFVP_07755 [Candidatus Bathyarchaeia archaeon]
MDENKVNPSYMDYIAAAMLSSGIIWFWIQLVLYFNSSVLQLLSYPVYIAAQGAASYLVVTRSNRKHLSVGIKTALASWLFAIFFTISFNMKNQLGFAIIILVCFLIGGVGGAYIALNRRLKSTKNSAKEDSSP